MDSDLLNGILTFTKKINSQLEKISRKQEEIKDLLKDEKTSESSFFSLLENEMEKN